MKKMIVMALAAMVAGSAMAWMFDGYFLAVGNGENLWKPFNNDELGELYSLTLGSQIKTFQGDNQDVRMNYAVYETGTTLTDDMWKQTTLGWCDNNDNSRWATGANWDSPAQVDIGFADLTKDKSYTIAVYFSDANDGSNYGNLGGTRDAAGQGNFTATFTKVASPVPEPATMSLLGLGALAMVIRRKLSK